MLTGNFKFDVLQTLHLENYGMYFKMKAPLKAVD